MEDLEKDTWNVIYTYLRDNKNYLTKHHLDSYNDFIKNKIPQTLKQYNDPPLTLYKEKIKKGLFKHTITIYFGGRNGDKVYLSQPVVYDSLNDKKRHMYPNEARLKDLSYASHLLCDILVEYSTIMTIDDDPVIVEKEFNNMITKEDYIKNEHSKEWVFDMEQSITEILINKTSLDKEIRNLIIYKKGLYNADQISENELLNILNPIIKNKSVWNSHALYLLAEYFYSKNQKQKSKEFFNQIINLKNSNPDIVVEAQKRLNRDLSD